MDENDNLTKPGIAGLIPPEESLRIGPSLLLHVAPHHDRVHTDGIHGVDHVGDAVVELAHVLGTADILCLLITDILTHKTDYFLHLLILLLLPGQLGSDQVYVDHLALLDGEAGPGTGGSNCNVLGYSHEQNSTHIKGACDIIFIDLDAMPKNI